MAKRIIPRLFWIVVCLMAVMLVFGPSTAVLAGKLPRKPIRVIYPFPAGSDGDIATRVFADAAGKRMELAPDVPTVEEDGIKVYPQLWTGIFAPKDIDAKALKKLKKLLQRRPRVRNSSRPCSRPSSPCFTLTARCSRSRLRPT